jgi:hypothetical protein
MTNVVTLIVAAMVATRICGAVVMGRICAARHAALLVIRVMAGNAALIQLIKSATIAVAPTNVAIAPVVLIVATLAVATNVALVIAVRRPTHVVGSSAKSAVKIRTATTIPHKSVVDLEMAGCVIMTSPAVTAHAVQRAFAVMMAYA